VIDVVIDVVTEVVAVIVDALDTPMRYPPAPATTSTTIIAMTVRAVDTALFPDE
jgi:hypothetical protein